MQYRINWFISPPYVARARQMPSLRGGAYSKGGLINQISGPVDSTST